MIPRAGPELSVIVPALDEAGCIGATLAALAPWRARGHEVLVVDGGSRDATAAIAAPLADRVLVAPRGRARQMNAGAAAARGKVFLFLHADTVPCPDADRELLEALARAGGGWGRFDVRLSGTHPLLRIVERAMNLRSRLTGIATGDQAMFVERTLFQRVGGFPDVALMEDLELSVRLKRIVPPLCLRGPAVTSSRRWERRGVARTVLTMWWLRARWALGADPQQLARRYYGD